MEREGQARAPGRLFLAHSLHLQDPTGRRAGRVRRWSWSQHCGVTSTRGRRGRSTLDSTAPADVARQRRSELAGDEGEVRRDHDAGLPAVHEGHVPWRDPHGHPLGALRRRDRRQHVRAGHFDPSSASGKKWLDKLVAKMVATGTRVQHISNNAPTNLASSDVALQEGRRRGREEVAGRREDPRRQVSAHELAPGAGTVHQASGGSRSGDGVSEERRRSCRT